VTFVTPTPYKTTGAYTAQADRRVMQTLAGGFEGVVGSGDLAVSADSPASMRVSVAAGRALVNGDSVARQGAYLIENDAALFSPYAEAAHPTNARRDLLVARVYDPSPDGGSAGSDAVVLEWVKGAEDGSLALGTIPPSAIPLARAHIAAGASTITSGNLTDWRAKLPPPFPAGEGATLPFNPVDGQTFRWTPTVTTTSGTPLMVWRMVYRAASNKWHCEGGLPVLSIDNASVNTALATYQGLGPTITPPSAGSYRVRLEADIWSSSTVLEYVSVTGGGLAGDTASTDGRAILLGVTSAPQLTAAREQELNLTTTSIVMALRSGTAGVTVNMKSRRLYLAPITIDPTFL
jgi:hypothetical protein